MSTFLDVAVSPFEIAGFFIIPLLIILFIIAAVTACVIVLVVVLTKKKKKATDKPAVPAKAVPPEGPNAEDTIKENE